ncbi:variable surface lipoprotein [Mycoplasmopsis agalactiae]|uniref:variable surface lipoprotein n=1 Tax=Mycoplasmopsis agalactiae TaxID=2110 RepID=UPI00211C44F2|nr:variable surface lipoprotein [Mycoplasmopsis agalactiae]UUM25776.1 variable surface lipoprotein [Mycoplasmopsis agalactiae]
MKKTKLLLLTSLSPIISLPFVAAKCNTDAKSEDMNKDKSEKDKMTSELTKSSESNQDNNNKNTNIEDNERKNNVETKNDDKGNKSLKDNKENGVMSEKNNNAEMSDMPMKQSLISILDKRPVNNVDAFGHDIGRWYDKVHEEDLKNFKDEFQKILKDIEAEIKKKVEKESTLMELESQFNSLKSRLEKKLDKASTWDHIDAIVDELDAVIKKI